METVANAGGVIFLCTKLSNCYNYWFLASIYIFSVIPGLFAKALIIKTLKSVTWFCYPTSTYQLFPQIVVSALNSEKTQLRYKNNIQS